MSVYNNRGQANVMLALLFFMMALAVVIMMISPMSEFLDIAQQSDNLNCRGFIFNGDSGNPLSFNSTLHGGNSGSPLSCLALKLYIPYVLLTFLIGGIGLILAGKAGRFIGIEEEY